MSYEVDVRKVGDESQSGDAITLRYGDFASRESYSVVVIDGGFLETGGELVEHIRTVYGTEIVDVVISTHPDADHSMGLQTVLEELTVKEIWMHLPWKHARAVAEYLETPESPKRFTTKLEKSLSTANELEEIALRKGIPIREPFTGVQSPDKRIIVLGPSEEYYEELLLAFEKGYAVEQQTLIKKAVGVFKEVIARIHETWDSEQLMEPEENATSPQNNSSTILLAQLDDKHFMFTGDAGVAALHRAYSTAIEWQVDLRSLLRYFDVPHHGSKRNLGPGMLNALVGPPVANGQTIDKTAFISVAKKGEPKHPSRRVINALIRRGVRVFKTQGNSLCHYSSDLPCRPGWSAVQSSTFSFEYED